eukprot:gene6248-10256_t
MSYCNSTHSTVKEECNSNCSICKSSVTLKNECRKFGKNSRRFLCDKIPKIKPKGFKMKYFWLNKCPTEKNIPTIFHVDEICMNENELMKMDPLLSLKTVSKNSKSSYRGWNLITKTAEMKFFKENDCKGEVVRTLNIKPNTCVDDGFGAYFYVIVK